MTADPPDKERAIDDRPWSCVECGALVEADSADLHVGWHAALRRAAVALVELAGIPSGVRRRR